MSQGRPRAAQTRKDKAPPPMAERISGGDLWEKPTKPDEDYVLLAKNPGMTRADYVDFPGRAVQEEPEACDKATVTEMSEAAGARFAAAHARELRTRKGRSLAGQIRELVSTANAQDVDLPELDKIEALLGDARQRLAKRAA